MMTDETDSDRHWDRGWDEHRRKQLARLAKLPFETKLEWLEEAQELGLRLLAEGQRARANQTRP